MTDYPLMFSRNQERVLLEHSTTKRQVGVLNVPKAPIKILTTSTPTKYVHMEPPLHLRGAHRPFNV